MSLGEDRVRAKFNVSASDLVSVLKQKTAELIDICDGASSVAATPEEKRLWALAMTSYEDAAMWAVKGATSEK